MHLKTAAITQTLLLTAAVVVGSTGAAGAQSAPPLRGIPQSILLQHEDDIAALGQIARRPGPLGVAAQKALDLLKRHHQREIEYILPPLTLLSALSSGKVTPDMRWAIEMADKVKDNREIIFQEHTEITDAMNALLIEAQIVNDKEAVDFAHAVVADSLGDLELQEPMTILIGEYLRVKLAPK